MTVHKEIIDLCDSIGPGCGLSQFVIDLAEEIPVECEDGLKQPHLTTHDGRCAVWGRSHDLDTLLEAASFSKQDTAFLEMIRKMFNEWGKCLESLYFADGGERPPTIKPQYHKHA